MNNTGHTACDPQWYKDAVIYELHIKAFCDSNGDGIGDFKGLIEKLDYLQDLGVTAIWLLPFYPSPLRDDGYDIADYQSIHPDYGNMRDFKRFLKAAHDRGLRVITELVLNHTSDRHAWFQKARLAKPGSAARNYYVWSDTADKYKEARIIFKDFEASNWTWDKEAGAYFWHRFYSHQPDLNFENPRVKKALFKVIDYWFSMGVDGMRLDAVPYLYEREGTNCENLEETHEVLRELRAYVDERYEDKMFLAEANQWPEDAVAYFGQGDECHMCYHFPIMPRIFMALWMEDRFPIIDILEQTPDIPDACQWAMFLRNHDELTLEMVSDEERDYMYRVYAEDRKARINLGIRRRLAPLLSNNRRRIELINFLLFSFPGTPIIYYGDEIGMGDNYHLGDRDGVRTPMQWSPDRNAGFSRVNPHSLYLPVIIDPEYHYEVINVENQEKNLSSLLWWMRRVIAMRKRFKALCRGSLAFVRSGNPKVLSFVRRFEDETVLVVVNLSRYSQVVEMDLSNYAGATPVDVFSQTRFPAIHNEPYVLPLGFHNYYWFKLCRPADEDETASAGALVIRDLRQPLAGDDVREALEYSILPRYLRKAPWFGAGLRSIRSISIQDIIPMPGRAPRAWLLLLELAYDQGETDRYLMPLSLALGDKADDVRRQHPEAVVTDAAAKGRSPDEPALCYDGVYDREVRDGLMDFIVRRRKSRGLAGEVKGSQHAGFRSLCNGQSCFTSLAVKGDLSNTAIIYEDSFFLKLYRRLEPGLNPEIEMVTYLWRDAGFRHVPTPAGVLEYAPGKGEPLALGLLQNFVPASMDGWSYALEAASRYYETILTEGEESCPEAAAISLASLEPPKMNDGYKDCVGAYFLEMVRVLGKRTAQMHHALARPTSNELFKPEPFSKLYRRSVYQSMRNLVRRTLEKLSKNMNRVPEQARGAAGELLGRERDILDRIEKLNRQPVTAQKIRIHGAYHLGQVLFTGKDFTIVDFEGDPAKPIGERRLKRSCLRDVAGMVLSFHYAAHTACRRHLHLRPEDREHLTPWVDPWSAAAARTFLASYAEEAKDLAALPPEPEMTMALLQSFLLEQAFTTLDMDLAGKPSRIPFTIDFIERVLRDFGGEETQ